MNVYQKCHVTATLLAKTEPKKSEAVEILRKRIKPEFLPQRENRLLFTQFLVNPAFS